MSQEELRPYATAIPNIIFDLLEKGLISSYSFAVYTFLLSEIDQNKTCHITTKKICDNLHIAKSSVAKAKKQLSSPIKELGKTPLLEIFPSPKKPTMFRCNYAYTR